LRGADAHAAGIERRVRAALDDHGAALGDLAPVAVMPDARESFEVRGAILLAVAVVPESDRHRGERLGAHELTGLAADGPALRVERVDGHAEPAALQFAAHDRVPRIAEREARDDVRAARDRRRPLIALHRVVDEIELLRRERRA